MINSLNSNKPAKNEFDVQIDRINTMADVATKIVKLAPLALALIPDFKSLRGLKNRAESAVRKTGLVPDSYTYEEVVTK